MGATRDEQSDASLGHPLVADGAGTAHAAKHGAGLDVRFLEPATYPAHCGLSEDGSGILSFRVTLRAPDC